MDMQIQMWRKMNLWHSHGTSSKNKSVLQDMSPVLSLALLHRRVLLVLCYDRTLEYLSPQEDKLYIDLAKIGYVLCIL